MDYFSRSAPKTPPITVAPDPTLYAHPALATGHPQALEAHQTTPELAAPQAKLAYQGDAIVEEEAIDVMAFETLGDDQIMALITAADQETRCIIGLCLCGVPLEDIPSLSDEALDRTAGLVQLDKGESRPLPPGLMTHLAKIAKPSALFTNRQDLARPVTDLRAMINAAALHAGLGHDAAGAATKALVHAYAVWLMSQRLKISALATFIGPLDPQEVMDLGALAPEGPKLAPDQVETIHPAAHTIS